MSRLEKMKINKLLACVAVVSILGVLGCSVDSPTAPDQVASGPPNAGANSWKISVSVTPDQIPVDSDVPATVNVKVESRTDGSNPPNGTTMTLSTSLGEFSAMDSGLTSVGVSIHSGKASALLFAGDVVATGTVTARLSGSEDRGSFQVTGAAPEMFITSLSPDSGSESGGTRVTIHGVGFMEPLRVTFEGNYATVNSVSDTEISVTTPPAPTNFLEPPVDCGGGRVQYVPKAADVVIEVPGGGGEEEGGSGGADLPGGFMYNPDNSSCHQP